MLDKTKMSHRWHVLHLRRKMVYSAEGRLQVLGCGRRYETDLTSDGIPTACA